MTSPKSVSTDDLYSEAAAWYARMASDAKTPADQAAFDRWIATSAPHADAYAEYCALSARLDGLEGHPDLDAIRIEARKLRAKHGATSRRFLVSTSVLGGMAAAAAAAILYVGPLSVETQSISTARGEIREFVLPDGTEATLGSDTKATLRFSRRRRALEVERGQVFLEVIHDQRRPFVASAGGRSVTALGTAFDVRWTKAELTVTLLQGKVAIGRTGEKEDQVILRPGQQFRFANGASLVRDVSAEAETSWRAGYLDLDNVTLGEAAAQFNANARNALIVSDPRVAALRVSGIFRTSSPDDFARALSPAYPVAAAKQSSGDVVLSYRSGAGTPP